MLIRLISLNFLKIFHSFLKDKHWDELGEKLPVDEVRYIAIQIDFKDAKGAAQNQIVFCSWVPDSVNIMRQMDVEKEKAAILKCLNGIGAEFKATSKDNFKPANIVKEKLKGTLD